MNGKLIVIEGLDGCGKTTQFELLKEHFKSCEFITFPCYDKPSGEIITQYLHGDFNETDSVVSAYTASTMYAVDRYVSYKTQWGKAYGAGLPIISARYVSSNAIYQMTKLPENEWNSYLNWLEDFEYNKFGIPRPTAVIYLDMPPEFSQKLLSERYDGDETKKDIHEGNLAFMRKCYEAAEYVSSVQNWKRINCVEDGRLRGIDEINAQLTQVIEDCLYKSEL